MSGKYIMNDHGEPEQCDDLFEWAKWMGSADRHVADETVDGVRVSTVFLGIDHSFSEIYGPRAPVLFETLVFGHPDDTADEGERYETREQAVAGHAKWVAKVKEAKR